MTTALADVLSETNAAERLRARLLQLAWYRYRIPRTEAEDVAQTTFATYLEVRHRYADREQHGAILVGIFRKKCLAHIDRAVREERRLRRYCACPDATRENPWIRPDRPGQARSVLDEIVEREARDGIREALRELRPSAHEIVALISADGLRRKELIERLRLNENTLDSRLHACRTQLRGILRKKGLAG